MVPDVLQRPSKELVLVGGEIASGKSALALGLGGVGSATVVRVRAALQEILGGTEWDRRRLQVEGADLDRRTNGRWLLEYLGSELERADRLVVDAARTRRQVEPILEHCVGARLVYLSASEATRRHRFALARAEDSVKRSMSFDDAMAHSTEAEARRLAAMANLVLETDALSVEEVVTEAARFLGWKGPA